MLIRESILKNVVTTLKTIKKSASYNNNIKLVTRKPHNWNNIKPNEKPGGIVLWREDTKEPETVSGSGQYVMSFLTIVIRGIVYSKTDIEEALNLFTEDIEKAMCVDETRGGYGEYTIPKVIKAYDGEDDYHITFDFEFVCLYNYLYGSP